MGQCKGVSQIHLNNDISLDKQVHVTGMHIISMAGHPNFRSIQISVQRFISLFLTLWETLYNFFQVS